MPYGTGSIYQRGRMWWISYMVRGEQVNESSKSGARADAEKLLKKRLGEEATGRAVSTVNITVNELLAMLEAHYIDEHRSSLVDLKGKIEVLKKEFGKSRASEFGTQNINRFKGWMKRRDRTETTINRYLEVLRRAFTLAEEHDPPLVGRVPHFELYDERDNVREGFLGDTHYQALLSWLPDHLKGLLIFGYHLGMRKTALRNLRRDQVDWPNKVIRTEERRGRKPIGRVLPIYGDMIPWLEMQMAAWDQTPKCRWILHHDGGRIGDFRKSWATACKAVGVADLLFHDLRRSAVRNMERAGVPRSQAMAITGHKTESIYKRYAIVSEQDVKAAGEKLGMFIEEQRKEAPSPILPTKN